jgi:hypothetical protein
LYKGRMVRHIAVDAQPAEPSIGRVQMNSLHSRRSDMMSKQ